MTSNPQPTTSKASEYPAINQTVVAGAPTGQSFAAAAPASDMTGDSV